METTILYRVGIIVTMEKKMETIIFYRVIERGRV